MSTVTSENPANNENGGNDAGENINGKRPAGTSGIVTGPRKKG